MGGLPGEFCGGLSRGAFAAAPIAPGGVPVELSLSLAFLADLHVPLTAVTTTFTTDGAGNLAGQINGAVRGADVWPLFGPPLAAWLNQQVAKDPHGQLRLIFDTGGIDDSQHPWGCLNPNGTPAATSSAPTPASAPSPATA